MKIGLEQHGKLYDSKAASKAVESALIKTKVYGLSLIQASTPVRTGEARAGWRVKTEGQGLTWQNNVLHSQFLEHGTVHMRARPMLAPNLPKIKSFFQKELIKAIGRKAASSIVSKDSTAVTFASSTSGFQQPPQRKRKR